MESSDKVVENESGECPRDVVDSRSRWHGSKTGEEDGDIDVSPERERVAASKEVEGNGEKDTDGEEEEEG